MSRPTVFIMALLVTCSALTHGVHAQSPAATARVSIGGKALSIRYSAPSVRGRQIFGPGGLLSKDPTYPVWRAGANEATTFTTEAALDLNGTAVPRGTYTLYVVVGNPNAWELVISRQTGQWGLDYDPKRDLARIPMTMSVPPTLVETLKYSLTDRGMGRGELRLEWERHVAVVPFTVK